MGCPLQRAGNSDDVVTGLAVNPSGNVYVTGRSYGSGTSSDHATVKYNGSGVEQWIGRYNMPGDYNDQAVDLVIDPLEAEAMYMLRGQQNYPNPFNPRTVIIYTVRSRESVSLKVFDVLGRELATLVNEQKDAGTHRVEWNAEGLSSGVYFCRLYVSIGRDGQAEAFVSTRKLLLLK